MTNSEKQKIIDFAKKLNNDTLALFRAAKLSKKQAIEHVIADSKDCYIRARKDFREENAGYMKKYCKHDALTSLAQLKLLRAV